MDKSKIEDLLRRVRATAKSKYRAAERLEQHHRFAHCTVALLAATLVSVLLVQVFGVSSGYSERALNMGETVLAVFALMFALLLGQESYLARARDMHRNGVDLSRFARELMGVLERQVEEPEYQRLVNRYYETLEKSENHKPIDYQFLKIEHTPQNLNQWPMHIYDSAKAYSWYFLLYIHYIFALGVAAAGLFMLIIGILSNNDVLN